MQRSQIARSVLLLPLDAHLIEALAGSLNVFDRDGDVTESEERQMYEITCKVQIVSGRPSK